MRKRCMSLDRARLEQPLRAIPLPHVTPTVAMLLVQRDMAAKCYSSTRAELAQLVRRCAAEKEQAEAAQSELQRLIADTKEAKTRLEAEADRLCALRENAEGARLDDKSNRLDLESKLTALKAAADVKERQGAEEAAKLRAQLVKATADVAGLKDENAQMHSVIVSMTGALSNHQIAVARAESMAKEAKTAEECAARDLKRTLDGMRKLMSEISVDAHAAVIDLPPAADAAGVATKKKHQRKAR